MNTVTTLKEEFPFDEVRDANGDYFDTVGEAMDAGFDLNQVWSVTEEDYIYDYSEEFADS